MRRYGQSSRIMLHMTGGVTIPDQYAWGGGYASIALTPAQEIFISLAGPFSGFLFAGLIFAGVLVSGGSVAMGTLLGFIPMPARVSLPFGGSLLNALAINLLWVNIFWGIFNLVPVYPLDGGHVTRYALMKADPYDGVRKSLWVSVIAGGLLAVVGLVFFRSIYMAFLFGLLAFQSFQMLQSRFGKF
jgi:membrane-associated protease RseP (regulator of RpoE activity)